MKNMRKRTRKESKEWHKTKFAPSIHSIYLLENKNIVELEDIGNTIKMDQTLKIYNLEGKRSQNGDTYITFIQKCR